MLVNVMNFQFTTRLDTDLVTVLTPSGSFDFQLADAAGAEVDRITGDDILSYVTPAQLTTLRTLLGEFRTKVQADSLAARATSVLTGAEDVGLVLPIQLLIGDKIYECRPVELPTNTEGYVFSDGTIAGIIAALHKAINLTGAAGTDYAASMTANAYVEAVSHTGTTLNLRALEPGEDGNLIPTRSITYPSTWTFTGSHMAGGAG